MAARRQPTVRVWAATQLAAAAPNTLAELLEPGAALVRVQQDALAGKPDAARALRRAAAQQRAAIVRLTQRAETLLVRAGQAASDATLARLPATGLPTDGHLAYVSVAPSTRGHKWVDHKRGEYVHDGVSTNLAETFFSQLKRSVDGTHHHVSSKHLPRYLAELDYRFSTRKLTDSARLRDLMSRTEGRRISQRPLD